MSRFWPQRSQSPWARFATCDRPGCVQTGESTSCTVAWSLSLACLTSRACLRCSRLSCSCSTSRLNRSMKGSPSARYFACSSCCCTASAMPVSFRCLQAGPAFVGSWVFLVGDGSSGAADVLVLLRQFWITERTCGQLVAATGQHRLELLEPHPVLPGWPAGSSLRLVMADTPRLRLQRSQAESVCLLGMGFLCQPFANPAQGARSMSAAHCLRRPWRPALLLAVTFRHVLRGCAHPRMVLRGWLATSCCW